VAFESTLGERVRTVTAGFVTSGEYAEVLVATYSGKVMSFTTEPILDRAPGDQHGKSVATISNENRLTRLRKEVEDLTNKVAIARCNVGSSSQQQASGRGDEILLADDVPTEDVNLSAKFGLDAEVGQFRLSIESQRPMDLIILRSPVTMDHIEDPSLLLKLTDAQRSQAAVSGLGDFGNSGVVTVISAEEIEVLKRTNAFIRKELGYGSSGMGGGGDGSGGDGETGFTLVCRCQAGCRKVNIFLFALEGGPGTLTTTVVVHQPGEGMNKAAKVLSFPIRALCLHSRVHLVDKSQADMHESKLMDDNENLETIKHLTDSTGTSTGRKVGVAIVNRDYVRSAVNRVTFRAGSDGGGNSSTTNKALPVSVMLEWLHHLLDNVPQRLKDDDEEGSFVFKNCLTSVETTCKLEQGALVIESANPSAVAIAKEYVSKFATQKRNRVHDQVQTEDDSVRIMVHMLWPKLEYQLSLARKIQLTAALDEVTTDLGTSGGDYATWMSHDYCDIVRNKEIIEKEWNRQSKRLQHIVGTLSDMYVDWWKLKGHDVRDRLADFNAVLMQATEPASILDMFLNQHAGSPVRSAGQFNFGSNTGSPEPMLHDSSMGMGTPSPVKFTDNESSREWRDAGSGEKPHTPNVRLN
jgi:hypothetical protein